MRNNLNILKNKNFKQKAAILTGALLLPACGNLEPQEVVILPTEEIMDCREYTIVQATFEGDDGYDKSKDPVYLLSRSDDKEIKSRLDHKIGLGDLACYREIGQTDIGTTETEVYLTGQGMALTAMVLDSDS